MTEIWEAFEFRAVCLLVLVGSAAAVWFAFRTGSKNVAIAALAMMSSAFILIAQSLFELRPSAEWKEIATVAYAIEPTGTTHRIAKNSDGIEIVKATRAQAPLNVQHLKLLDDPFPGKDAVERNLTQLNSESQQVEDLAIYNLLDYLVTAYRSWGEPLGVTVWNRHTGSGPRWSDDSRIRHEKLSEGLARVGNPYATIPLNASEVFLPAHTTITVERRGFVIDNPFCTTRVTLRSGSMQRKAPPLPATVDARFYEVIVEATFETKALKSQHYSRDQYARACNKMFETLPDFISSPYSTM